MEHVKDNNGTGSALAQRRQSRRRRGRHVRLCGQIHGRLLSPVLPVAHGQAEERHVLRDLRGCGSRWLQGLPAVQSQGAVIVRGRCRGGRGSLPAIEDAEELPKLDELAASVGMSPFYFHRQFKAITGLTPKAYGAAHRAKRVRAELADAQDQRDRARSTAPASIRTAGSTKARTRCSA